MLSSLCLVEFNGNVVRGDSIMWGIHLSFNISGAGWYEYESPGAKLPNTSDFIVDFLTQFRKNRGIEPRRISPQVIHPDLL